MRLRPTFLTPRLAGALAVALALAACGSSGKATTSPGAAGVTTPNARPIKVVVTTTQLGDVVRNIGGDAAAVAQILQPNTDPHEYEPRPNDVKNTAGAKIVFESGDNLDKWMAKVVDESGGKPTVVTLSSANVDRLAGEASGPEASRYDPHWWHDPRNVEAAVPVIRDALTAANPAARSTYDANAAAYLAQLRTLDAGIARCFAQVPPSQRKLVTDHDAFNYFAKRYDIDVIGAVIPSQTTQAQASAGEVAGLTALIRREHVTAVFPESSVNPKLANAIAQQSGATANHTLYGDTLGPLKSPGGTYLTMEQANANDMLRGFTDGKVGCAIPGI